MAVFRIIFYHISIEAQANNKPTAHNKNAGVLDGNGHF
jgi:hypothetical protein